MAKEDDDLKFLREMFKQEHTRWNQHTLLFLGIIGSIILSFQTFKDVVSLRWIFLAAAITSFIWLMAIIANRKSTWAWIQTIKSAEDPAVDKKSSKPHVTRPFSVFLYYSNRFDHLRDACFLDQRESEEPRPDSKTKFVSVTRSYQLIAMLLIVTFCILCVREFYYNKPNQDIERFVGKLIVGKRVTHYPDAVVTQVYGPFYKNRKEFIKAELLLTTGEPLFLEWCIDSSGNMIAVIDSNMNP